ncbi:FxDxF family PEP-CTERM protein [Piscinibacter terrae]|uniref:PEP-CTERM protein-sorting domain-containing protein n=1 Tax=Piscinibacter terrae TaxID=2496871 RepID=A0A3N7HJ67_9BURK|nr:FxDxF family PEP-CTERM protein [Albitalea terrae]RQP22088.1 hypothetical protein DZC73_24065 [Albitalea terrae]
MKIKSVVAVAALALAGTANAISGPGYLGVLDNAAVEVSNVVAPGSFIDYYTFDVTGSGLGGAFTISIPFPTDETHIDFNFLGFFDASNNLLNADVDGSDGWGVFAGLPAAGTYKVAIGGIAGAVGGIYDGYIATSITPAVPETETYALMLGGLALLGLVRRQRKG